MRRMLAAARTKKHVMIMLAVLLSWILPSWACGKAQPSETSVERQPSESLIKSITTLRDDGGRLDWSPKRDLIAFDMPGQDGHYQVYTLNPDGSNEICLTCDKSGAPARHKGNPAWHPSGDYLVFQAEKRDHSGLSSFSTPGLGKDNDLWLMTSDGNTYYPLTDVDQKMGVLHPHFSHDGSKLLWAEKVGIEESSKNITEQWALKIADFALDKGRPRLVNVRTYQPLGPVFYESHGFSKDDTKIIFTAYLEPDQQADTWLDIYTMEIATLELKPLTHTIAEWDEHAQYSPSGNKIAWMSSTSCDCDPHVLRDLRTDLWLMEANGSGKERLTHFSDSGYPEYIGPHTIVADMSWSPDGTKLALYVFDGRRPLQAMMMMIEFTVAQ